MLYNLAGMSGSRWGWGGGDRPKYIICNCSIFLVRENSILSIRLQFMPLCFRLKEKLQTLKKGHNSKYSDIKISDYSRVVGDLKILLQMRHCKCCYFTQ